MLLLRFEETHHFAQPCRTFAGQKLLLQARLGTGGVQRQRQALGARPALDVANRIPRNLEQRPCK